MEFAAKNEAELFPNILQRGDALFYLLTRQLQNYVSHLICQRFG